MKEYKLLYDNYFDAFYLIFFFKFLFYKKKNITADF